MAQTTLSDRILRDLGARLKAQHDEFARHYPGESGTRQPVHTVYGGSHLFKSDTTRKLGELAGRALRTLDVFLTGLGGALPPNFVVTLPKITAPEQVTILVAAFEALEAKLGLAKGSLKLECMVETTQCILDHDGTSMLPKFIDAAKGRMTGGHFGTYDYTASCDITAAYQAMRHPACDFAKHMMKVAYAGTSVFLSDGATTTMPVAPHKGDALGEEQKRENARAVHAAWRLHADDVRHSLANGFYQGWDLHPGQLPSRYGTVYAFFLRSLPATLDRLQNFINKAAQATLHGDTFDDAATGQGLLNFFLRGVNCGALTEQEALSTGLTIEEFRGRSFLKILNNRKASAQKA